MKKPTKNLERVATQSSNTNPQQLTPAFRNSNKAPELSLVPTNLHTKFKASKDSAPNYNSKPSPNPNNPANNPLTSPTPQNPTCHPPTPPSEPTPVDPISGSINKIKENKIKKKDSSTASL